VAESIAQAVGAILPTLAGGRFARLPFALRFWDGSLLPANRAAGADRGTVDVGRRAVGQILHQPNQLGLSRAFISGQLRFDGPIRDVLARRSDFDGVALTPRELATIAALAVRLAGVDAVRPSLVPEAEMRARGRRHSILRDRRSVRHHYDVSNAFYRQLLGPTMVYSCAYFADPDESLDTAQERKLERICRKLRLQAGERFLDIGCGWGSLAIRAAREHGVRAVGITLSEPQAQLARERAAQAGVADRVEIRVADYRETHDGPYDKIASIGMVEHVGLAQMDAYAATIAGLLRPGGLALNHGITRLFSQHPAGPKSLIQRYVFPDGEILALEQMLGPLRAAGLEPRDVESMREHYALTLWRWVDNLTANRDAAIAEIGIERTRVWDLYMTGSALAFEDGDIDIYQTLLAKPGADPGLSLVRDDLRD
jgi:cyclopropane-fatty-acyl-phospholipid synthase